jgi:hypothetical protein
LEALEGVLLVLERHATIGRDVERAEIGRCSTKRVLYKEGRWFEPLSATKKSQVSATLRLSTIRGRPDAPSSVRPAS